MSKQSIVAILVFAALLGGVYLANQQPAEKGISRISLAKVDTDAIDAITVEGPEAVSLRKEGEVWKVDGKHRASAAAVTAILTSIPKIVSSELATDSAERFAHFEVDAEKGHKVVASAGGKTVAEFVVGKAAASGSAGTHVRVGDEVFVVDGIYPYTFARKAAQWFELKLFDEKLEAITRVELGPAGAPYALEQQDGVWALAAAPAQDLPEGFRFDEQAAKNRASALLNLRARELVTEDPGAEKTGLGEGAAKVAFLAGEAKTVLLLGEAAVADGTTVYGRVEGSEALYLLHGSNVEALLAPASKLRSLSLMDLDPAQVRSLEIVQGKDRLLLEKGEAGWAVAETKPAAPADFEFDPARAGSRLSALKNARALGLAEGETEESVGLKRPAATVTATLEGGEKAVLVFGEEQETDGQKWVPAMGNVDDAVYRLSVYVKNNLTGGIETFKKVATPQHPGGMPGFDPEMMKNLPPEVREALMKKQLEQQRMQNLATKLPPAPKGKAE